MSFFEWFAYLWNELNKQYCAPENFAVLIRTHLDVIFGFQLPKLYITKYGNSMNYHILDSLGAKEATKTKKNQEKTII